MTRPAYQWYPGDFRRDMALQACSWEARSLWRDLLDIMHDGRPYGHLAVNGNPISPQRVGAMIGLSVNRVTRYLAELERAGVPSRTENGILFSRRMVRDEEIRVARASGGGKSQENPNVPRSKDPTKGYPSSHPPVGPTGPPSGDPLQFASASASANNYHPPPPQARPELSPVFLEAWAIYPKRPNNSRAAAWRAWSARLKGGESEQMMLEGTRRYAAFVQHEQTDPRYIKQASTFYGPDQHYANDFTVPEELDEYERAARRLQAEEQSYGH